MWLGLRFARDDRTNSHEDRLDCSPQVAHSCARCRDLARRPDAAFFGRRGVDRRHARGARTASHHVARDRATVPRAYRHVRGQAARRDHGESACARDRRLARSRASGRPNPWAAARHSGRAQGQRPYHRHADHRRRARVRRTGAAVRGDAHEESRGGGGDHPREDAAHRARQLGRERHAGQLQRPQRLRDESVGSTPRPARHVLRRASGADYGRLELGRWHQCQLLDGERRN